MKLLLACLLVATVSATPYNFPTDGSAVCKLLNMTANIDIQTIVDGQTTKTVTVDLSKAVVDGDGCPNDTATSTTLSLTLDDGSKLGLIFALDASKLVTLTTTYTFNPNNTFGNGDTGPLTVSFSGLPLTTSDKSFECIAEQSMMSSIFNSTSQQYRCRFNAHNLKVQVFNVKNGAFSAGDSCPEDDPGTSPDTPTSSIKPQTSSENPKTSSEAPGTSSSSDKPTTSPVTKTTTMATTMAPLPRATFELKGENNETCILLETSDSISVSYEQKDNKTAVVKDLEILEDAVVSGECAVNETGAATLILTYGEDEMEFMFTDAKGIATLTAIKYTYTLDSTRFPNATDQNEKVNLTYTAKAMTSKDDTFYVCNAVTTVVFPNSETKVMLSNFKVQAFNVKESNFTGAGEECDADKTTTPAQTTSAAPVTTVAPDTKPPVNNYTVGECILVKTGLTVKLPYTKKDNTQASKEFIVPKTATFDGSCQDNKTQELTITFHTDWTIKLVFATTSDSLSATADKSVAYALENITVDYTITKEFTDAKDKEGTKMTISASKQNVFPVSDEQKSYLCKSTTTIKLGDGNLQTEDFQYRAFAHSNTTTFADSGVNECAGDSDSNSVVPIAVGAALAGLVVIVLIAYLIGRRRSKRAGYESV